MVDFTNEFELLAEAYAVSGGNPLDLRNEQYGLMLVAGNHILGKNEIPGLRIESELFPDGVKARITVAANTKIEKPVHLCFGVIPAEGIQRILADFFIEENAKVSFLAHCTFPNAVKIQHIMEGTIQVGKNSQMEYNETHFHGPRGGVEVLPKMKINVERGGQYSSTFRLIKGAAGVVRLDYEAYLSDESVAELYAKIFGKYKDDIQVKESIYLNGTESRGLVKSRIILADEARAEVLGEVIGKGVNSRGHIDCMEIVQGKKAKASAVPRLQVVEESSKLTHEAAIGSVDKRQVETLMARGLSEQEAVDVIVRGLLK